jgi:hypothetical protein
LKEAHYGATGKLRRTYSALGNNPFDRFIRRKKRFKPYRTSHHLTS